jgi:hypothetical protein
MHRRVTDVVTDVHFDCDCFVLDALAQTQAFQNQIEFGGQCFFGFQTTLPR